MGNPYAEELTVVQAAVRVGLSVDTLRHAMKAGRLPARQVGGRGKWLVTRTDLDHWYATGALTKPEK